MKKLLNRLHIGSDPTNEESMDTEEANSEQEKDSPSSDKWDAAAVSSLGGGPIFSYGAPPCGAPLAGSSGSVFGAYAAPMAMQAAPKGRLAAAAPPPAMPCMPAPAPAMCFAAAAAAPAAFGGGGGGAIGFKAGGAQDVKNFRENIQGGHLPLLTDCTYEGCIKDYFFDTSSSDAPPCTELFCPTYSLALAPNPLAAAPAEPAGGACAAPDQQAGRAAGPEVFLAVGLDSGITDFKRPKLNLNILLDVSGSMDCCFNRYYYGGQGQQQQLDNKEAGRTKLDVAKEVIKGMLDRLQPEDTVSISLFSDRAATPKRLGRWASADVASVKAGVDQLRTVGGTNFQAGLEEATAQLRGYADCIDGDPATTENRIIVLTDAEANCGDISETGLLARLKANAADRFFTTIVGVGLDFNTQLVEGIMKVRGANYFSVHTPGEFKRRLEEEFDFMVAPLVFDLELRIDPASLASPPPPAGTDAAEGSSASGNAAAAAAGGGGWRVLQVYGSPDSEERRLSGSGSIMRINTLFPSAKTEEGIKGGVVLLHMQPPAGTDASSAPPLRLAARYTDRSGQQYNTLRTVEVPPAALEAGEGGYFQSSGVRKAVALARYVDALRSWLSKEWATSPPASDGNNGWDASAAGRVGAQGPAVPPVPPHSFGCYPGSRPGMLGPWERTSRPLSVGPESKAALRRLLPYMEREVAAVGDTAMQQEVELLQKLVAV